jgi:hypothetical protein
MRTRVTLARRECDKSRDCLLRVQYLVPALSVLQAVNTQPQYIKLKLLPDSSCN